MTLKISKRGNIPPFLVMEILAEAKKRAASGEDIIHLEAGQPASAAPKPVIETAQRSLQEHPLGYTEPLGLPELRHKIAQYYHDYYSVTIDPEQVIITTGSSAGFLLSFLAAFDPGDRVGISVPGYPAYRNILIALGIKPVELRIGPTDNFRLTTELLAACEQPLDGLILASPANPTGAMLNNKELQTLINYCRDHKIRFIADEIYHGITFDQSTQTAIAYDPECIIINSFSKYFCMTGWRLGWMVVPENLLHPVTCLAQNLFVSPPTLPQYAALKVFDCRKQLDDLVKRYRINRDLLRAALPALGFQLPAPTDGAFYLYTDISQFSDDSVAYCRRMLTETGIAATPGVDFDPMAGKHYVRFSFAGETEKIQAAIARLQRWK